MSWDFFVQNPRGIGLRFFKIQPIKTVTSLEQFGFPNVINAISLVLRIYQLPSFFRQTESETRQVVR
jgi:hypothetical protein